jgi:hypothetical protein
MALNFGLMGDAAAPVAGYLQGQQEAQRNQLAQQQLQVGSQQLETGRLQQQKAQLDLNEFQRRQEGLNQFIAKAKELGHSGDPMDLAQTYWEHAISSGDPKEIMAAQIAMQAATERKQYMAAQNKPAVASAPAAYSPGALGSGTFDPNAPANALAPTAPAFANALATPAAAAQPTAPKSQLDKIEARMSELRNYPNVPQAKMEYDELAKIRAELYKPQVVGRNQVVAGVPVFTAPQDVTPTNLSKLVAERNALPPNDPQRKIYDAAINKETYNASAADLAFRKTQDEWNKKNPGFQLEKVDQPDGSVQFVGVDKRTLVSTPIMTAPPAGAMPTAAPAGAGRGSVGVTDTTAGVPLVGAAKNAQTTEGERKAATLLQRLQFSQGQLMQALKEKPDADKPGLFASAVGKLSTTGENLLNSAERQRVQAAQLDILDAALTLGTGAAYTKEQLEGYRTSYFPAYGDDPKTILDKQARLKNIIEAAKTAAGRAAKLVPAAPAAAGGGSAREAADKILGL